MSGWASITVRTSCGEATGIRRSTARSPPNPDEEALSELIAALGVKVPTAQLAHTEGGGYCSIDHIAVPNSWNVTACARLVARGDDNERLSDHDAYVIEAER